MEQTLYKQKNPNIIPATDPVDLSAYIYRINTQLESNTSPYELYLYKLHIISVVVIISDLSAFRRELQLEIEKMHTTYEIVVTWRRDWDGTWHVGCGLLIQVTMLLSLWTLGLVKVKIKYFWFVAWPHYWSVTWLCGWISLILNHHPAKFWIHTLYESGNIKFFICQVIKTLKCHVTLWVRSLHPKSPPC